MKNCYWHLLSTIMMYLLQIRCMVLILDVHNCNCCCCCCNRFCVVVVVVVVIVFIIIITYVIKFLIEIFILAVCSHCCLFKQKIVALMINHFV